MQATVKDAATLLGLSEKTIYRWIKQGAIPAYRINDQFRFNRAELLEWATARRIQVSPAIFSEDASGATPLPSLCDALKTGGVAYRVEGRDRASSLRAVVELMNLPEEVDRQFLYQVLLARENLGTTAMGDGIAIPHVRNPVVLHVTRPSVTLCFLENAIDFGALDGRPVSILFTLISPTVRAHLHLLSRLAFVLRQADFKRVVLEKSSRETIASALAVAEALIPIPDARGKAQSVCKTAPN